MRNPPTANVKHPIIMYTLGKLLHKSFSSSSNNAAESVKLLLLTEFIIILFRASFLYLK
jgi:hypothetical protein